MKRTFSSTIRRALSNRHEKRKINSSEIFNCEHRAYTINTVKIKYLPIDKPRAPNILTLLVWHSELSFDADRLHFSRGQHKHLHCKNDFDFRSDKNKYLSKLLFFYQISALDSLVDNLRTGSIDNEKEKEEGERAFAL